VKIFFSSQASVFCFLFFFFSFFFLNNNNHGRKGCGGGVGWEFQPELMSFSLGVPMSSSNCEFTNVCSYCTAAMVILYSFPNFGYDLSYYADGNGIITVFGSPVILCLDCLQFGQVKFSIHYNGVMINYTRPNT